MCVQTTKFFNCALRPVCKTGNAQDSLPGFGAKRLSAQRMCVQTTKRLHCAAGL
jgi:hypothetical protein